jgi:hypothetical protein
MATLVASSVSVYNHTAPHGARANGSGNLIFDCYVAVKNILNF